MKALLIVHNQSISEEVEELLAKLEIRGFTRWLNVQGQGMTEGDPHLGTHIWPSLNVAILAVVDDGIISPALEGVKEINALANEEGIRAFVWNIEGMV